MKTPLVSILIPVYNAELFLKDCLESIIDQTYKNLQIILVDDGSTDRSLEIALSYSDKDNRITVYSQPNKGVATARNELLKRASGDFVLFVDSDDWIENNTVELIMREQACGDFDIVSFEMIGSGNNINGTLSREEAVLEFLRHKNFREGVSK